MQYHHPWVKEKQEKAKRKRKMKEDEDEKNLAIRARTDLPPLDIQPLTPLETEQISYLLEIQVLNILNM